MTAPSPTVHGSSATPQWVPEVFRPFADSAAVVFARVAARSAAFGSNSAGGGRPVLVGSAAGATADDVAVRARGELMERMGNVLTGRAAESGALPATRTATYSELRHRGIPAVDPALWGAAESRAARQLWVRGRALSSDGEAWVPAGAAFLQHRPPPGYTATVRAGSTGVGAHPRREAATAHAAWEILERELIRRSWCAPEHHRPSAHDALAGPTGLPLDLRALLVRERLCATALLPPAPRQVCAVVVCLHTEDGRLQSFGASCGPPGGSATALAKAAFEALMVRWSMGTAAARRALQRLETADRPHDAVEHALWAFHRQDALRHWLGGHPAGGYGPVHHTSESSAVGLPDPVDLLTQYTGLDVIAVDCPTGAPNTEDMSVVRLVAPGARPLPTRTDPGIPPHPFG
ncbi:YcaO-like family protein [Streptomyces sp. NPDC029216]|uniref:YcaO-like family protein n=1 Tax=Streptomyces sp. NPDC029216 TaxID=3154701 RepID=UPI0033EC5E1E